LKVQCKLDHKMTNEIWDTSVLDQLVIMVTPVLHRQTFLFFLYFRSINHDEYVLEKKA